MPRTVGSDTQLPGFNSPGDEPDRRWPKWPPRLRLYGAHRPVLSLVIAAAIPILLFSVWAVYLAAERERAAARKAVLETAGRVAERVVAELATQLQVIDALGGSATLDELNLAAFYGEARRLTDTRPLWETMELVEPSGKQVLNLLRPVGDILGPTADRESFDEVVRTRRPVIGGIGPVGLVSGRRLVALRVPVVRNGELRYVLSVLVAPSGVSSILRGAGAPEGWVGAIVDAKGDFVARTLAEESEVGRPASPALRQAIASAPAGFYRGRTLEGVEVETVYRTLPEAGRWSVHFGIPSELLDAPVRRSLYVMAGGAAGSMVLGAGLASLLARDMAQRRRDEAARAAAALRVSEERAAVAVEAAELGTLCWDAEGNEVVGSERCRALLDVPHSPSDHAPGWKWPAEAFFEALHAEDRATVQEAVRRCLAEDTLLDLEFRAVWRDGSVRWVRLTGRATSDETERHKVIHGVIADIEPRKRSKAERLHLLRRLAETQEDEQRRIARELHDQVGQTVTGLSLGLKGLERTLDRQGVGSDLHDQVRWLQNLTVEIGRDIHRAAAELRPTALDDLGLQKALIAQASEWKERFGLSVDVQALGFGNDDRLPPEVETAVYRIVQEALTNVLKHAAARNVSLVLERKLERLRVLIEDDGQGFDPDLEAAPASPGSDGRERPRLGLSGIRERLTLLGGTLTVESTPDSGTTLFVSIPLGGKDLAVA